MFNKMGLQAKITLVIIVPFISMLLFYSGINISLVNKEARKQALDYLDKSVSVETYKADNLLKLEFNYLNELSTTISDMYGLGIRGRDGYEKIISNYSYIMPNTMVGLACLLIENFVDNDIDYRNSIKYSNANGRFLLYYVKSGSGISIQPIGTEVMSLPYISKATSTKEATIRGVHPYRIAGVEKQIYSWAIPIIDSKNILLGIIVADVLVEDINKQLAQIKPYEESIALLFDHEGNLIYNVGKNDFVGENVYTAYPYYKDYNLIDRISKGESVHFETKSAYFGEKATFIVDPIKMLNGYNWGLEIVTPNRVILERANMIRNIMLITTFIISIITCIITPIIIKSNVSNVIVNLSNNMLAMAEGDLTIEPPENFLNRQDEWGDISRSWNIAMDNFNDILNKVMIAADHVSTAANEVRQGNYDLSIRTESQVSSLEETASSMNEIASTIKESTSNVYESNLMVTEAKGFLNKAGDIVENSVQKMDDVYEASSKIMDITKLIENIAFQTNILALNASVEAARAGDQGRGFAVVASEVRNLAQNTQESVKSITDLITDSNNKIQLAADSVKESKEIFVELADKMDSVSRYMDQINVSAQEQQAGVDQINSAINQMEGSLQQNAALVEEATASSEALLNEAKELNKSISYFKIKNSEE